MMFRNAEKRDASQLENLLLQLGYEMTLEEVESRILAFDVLNHQLIVAEQKGIVIGVIAYACYQMLRFPGSHCVIDTLVINKDYRGQGIGRSLMLLAEKYAGEHQARAMELTTLNHGENKGAHDFYKALGYKSHLTSDLTYFSKSLLQYKTKHQQ